MLILRPGSAWTSAPPWTTPTGPPQKDPFAPLRDQKREDQHAAPSSPPLVFGLPFGRRFSAFDLLGCQIAMGSSEIRATILRCVPARKRRWVCLIVRVKCNAGHVAQNDGGAPIPQIRKRRSWLASAGLAQATRAGPTRGGHFPRPTCGVRVLCHLPSSRCLAGVSGALLVISVSA